MNDVTDKKQLERLAVLYNFFIDLHLVPNILVEIYSTFEMLAVKEAKDAEKQSNSDVKEGKKITHLQFNDDQIYLISI